MFVTRVSEVIDVFATTVHCKSCLVKKAIGLSWVGRVAHQLV